MNERWRIAARISAAIATGVLLLGSCMSLDPFLFKEETTDAYQFDEYQGPEGMQCADALDSLGPTDMKTVHEFSIASGSETIAAVLVAPETTFDSTDTMILYIHGTSLHIDFYWARVRLLAATGHPVLAMEFRGYGKSTGTPTEAGIYEDGFSTLRYIREHLGNPRVVVYAFSLGTLVGCEIAAYGGSDRVISLVLEAPIGSIETMIQDAAYIDLPGSWIVSYEGKNVEKIKSVEVPLLWLHGTDDETLPIETNGKPVYRNYLGSAGSYVIIEHAGHRTIPTVIGYARYIEAVTDFIAGRAAQNALFQSELE